MRVSESHGEQTMIHWSRRALVLLLLVSAFAMGILRARAGGPATSATSRQAPQTRLATCSHNPDLSGQSAYPLPPGPSPTPAVYALPSREPSPTPTVAPQPPKAIDEACPPGRLFEAERGILTPPMRYGYDEEAYGGWFVHAFRAERRGAVTIALRVDYRGFYLLHGRTRAFGPQSDSFHVTLGGAKTVVWSLSSTRDDEWQWSILPVGVQLWEPGTYMLRIEPREAGVQLDAIIAERIAID